MGVTKDSCVILIDPNEQAALCLKAAVPWKEKGFSFGGVYPEPLACPIGYATEPLLVISEVIIPGISYRDVFKSLRGRFPKACLAVLTADIRLEPAMEAFRHGILRYILKPFSLEHITELLAASRSAIRIGNSCAVLPGEMLERDTGMAGRVQAYVQSHYTDHHLTLKSIAEEFHLNYSYLSFLFKKQIGMTFSDYVCELRIRFVKELLKDTEMKMSQIAQAAGFSDSQVLYYAFKNATGMTPKIFRENIAFLKDEQHSDDI